MATQRERKTILKEEAEERAKIYNNMSLKERLKLIRSRRGKSKKEVNKILNQMKEINSNGKTN